MELSIECNNEDCGEEFSVDLDMLSKESHGASGNHTTSYSYKGAVQCPDCDHFQEVEFVTDESDETEEKLSINKVW